MRTRGYFPFRVYSNENSTYAYRKSDGSFAGYLYPGSSSDEGSLWLKKWYEDVCKSTPISTNTTHSDVTVGGWGYVTSGRPRPVPAPVTVSSTVIKPSNGKRWKNRKKSNEIVLSDYKRFQAYITFENGGPKENISYVDKLCDMTWVARAAGIVPKAFQTSHGMQKVYDLGHPYLYFVNGAVRFQFQYFEQEDTGTALDAGFSVDPIIEYLNGIEIDDMETSITKVYADANKSTVDILTAALEAPETVKSIYNGLRLIVKMGKDASKRRFSLLNKAKRVKADYERKVFRLEFASRNEYLKARNERSRRIIANKLKRDKKQLKSDMERTSKQFIDEAASVWLNFRYNIGPTAFLIEDLTNALFEKDKVFFRERALVISELKAPICVVAPPRPLMVEKRVCHKRRVLSKSVPLGQHLSASIFTTAWELIPLSFVIDWVINIGDFIASAAPASLSKDWHEGTTLSLKLDDTITYRLPNGSSATIHFKGYKRQIINASDYCRLTFAPNIDLVRQIDALSLSWKLFIKDSWKTR